MHSHTTHKLTFEEKKSEIKSLPDEKMSRWESLQYMHATMLLASIQNSEHYDISKKGYFVPEQKHQKTPENIQREKQKKHIISVLKTFNAHFHSSSTSQLTESASLKKLQELAPALRRFSPYCPHILPWMTSYYILENANTKTQNEVGIFNKIILVDLNKYTKKLLKEVIANYNYNYSDLIKSAKEKANERLKPYYPIVFYMLEFFNSWFTPQAVRLHNFELPALNAAELHWQYLLKILQDPAYFKDLQQCHSTLRPLLSLYHWHLEERLKQLRAAASKQQIEHTLLDNQFADLAEKVDSQVRLNQSNEQALQHQIEEALNQETGQESAYKQALNKITAIHRYDKIFKGLQSEKLPPAVVKITQLINEVASVEKPATSATLSKPTAGIMTSQEQKESKKDDIAKYPVITTYLFDLKAIQTLNENTSQLLQALQTTYFLYPKKQACYLRLIALIQNFNGCFRVKNLSNTIVIEQANLCLQELIVGIQYPSGKYASSLFHFGNEDTNNIGKLLQDFLSLYGQTLTNNLEVIYAQHHELKKLSAQLKQKIILLKEQLHSSEKWSKPKLTMAPETKKEFKQSTRINNPYKEALLNIARIIFCATEIECSAQLIPVLMAILKHSYIALDQPKAADEVKEEKIASELSHDHSNYPVTPLLTAEEEAPRDIEDKTVMAEKLPWESLAFIHEYSKILFGKYSSYHSEDNWALWFGGFTDRLAGASDRQRQYIRFCNRIKQRLEVFNNHFMLTPSQPVTETVLVEANAALQQIIKEINRSIGHADSLSHTFYKIYEFEKNKMTGKNIDLAFLSWEQLKKLNAASQEALLEMQLWQDIHFGYLTNVTLSKGAVQYFNRQFLSETIRENKDSDKTLAANKALLCFMHIVYRDNKYIDLSLSRLQLLPFIIQYNRYVQETINQLHISINRKKLHNHLLEKVIQDLKESKNADRDKGLFVRNRIHAILQAELNTEPACKEALRKISTTVTDSEQRLPSKIAYAFKGIFASAPIIPVTLNKVKEVKTIPVVEDGTSSPKEVAEVTPFLTWEALNRLQKKAADLLQNIPLPSIITLILPYKKIETIRSSLENFQQCFTSTSSEELANNCLQELVRNISYCPSFNNLEENLKWELQLFLSTYSRTITQHLQHLRRVDYNSNLESEQLTAQIDRLRRQQSIHPLSSQPTTHFKPLIQQALEKERATDKPAEKTVRAIANMIFSLEKSEIDVDTFPILMAILQSVYAALHQPHEEKENESRTYSLKFR